MKIVQFQDGKYGIRSSWFWLSGTYISLRNHKFTYSPREEHFYSCKSDDLERVKLIYADLTGKHKVIKVD